MSDDMTIHWKSSLMDYPYCGKGMTSYSSPLVTVAERSKATCETCNPAALDETKGICHGSIELQIPHLRFSYATLCKQNHMIGRSTKNHQEITCGDCLRTWGLIQEYFCKRCRTPLFNEHGFLHQKYDIRNCVCDKTECVLFDKITKYKVLRNEIKTLFTTLEEEKKKAKVDELLTQQDIDDMVAGY